MVGAYHHRKYNASKNDDADSPSQPPALVRAIHIWLGRLLLVLGCINGGLGLWFADDTLAGMESYSAVAGVIGVLYILTLVVWYGNRRRALR